MEKDIQVYCENNDAPRLRYAVDLVLSNILGLSFEITASPDPDRPLINYSSDRSVGGIFIEPEGLLFETGIRKQDIWVAHLDGIPLFFQQPPEAGFVLDIFSFAFYMVSRYEEYLTFTRDEHGRFAAESSLAYKHNFLNLPVVDIWAQRLVKTINILYPEISIKENEYCSIMTFDLDQPFAYRGKGLFRNLGGILMDMIEGRNARLRIGCMSGAKKDPYDTYDYIEATVKEHNSSVIFFYTAGGRGKYDKNPNPQKKCYKSLIRRLSSEYGVGLHPSYKSNKVSALVMKEKSKLEKVTGEKVNNLRKHFLLLNFPHTYRQLLELGIKTDYTLGFVREAGFRAGIARPFRFYDILAEEATDMTLIPFQYMDGTFQQHKRFSPEQAKAAIKSLIEETRKVGGIFVSVWHNTSLTDMDVWKGWREVYEFTLKEQKK